MLLKLASASKVKRVRVRVKQVRVRVQVKRVRVQVKQVRVRVQVRVKQVRVKWVRVKQAQVRVTRALLTPTPINYFLLPATWESQNQSPFKIWELKNNFPNFPSSPLLNI